MTDGRLWIDVLGPLRVRNPKIVEIQRPAQRRVLSILALANGQRISTEALIDRYWPDGPPDTARAAIQTHIATLRKQLGDGVIVTEGYGYRLNLEGHGLDSAEFTQLSNSAATLQSDKRWNEGLEQATAAMELWRGQPFSELADDEFARAEVARLAELNLELLEVQAECRIALGRSDEALPQLEALVIDHPYRERLWEHLMTARYQLGRHTEALRAYHEVSEQLAEIGVEPGKALRRLEEKILLHDESLTRTRNNLAIELDSFVGRGSEITEISGHLKDNRLVTLVGAGGSGKTRLAREVARTDLNAYPDGVWFIELADIDDGELIPSLIGTAIGLPQQSDDLLSKLERIFLDQTTLLVLDNCEHLIDAAASVTERLLRSARDLTILATSREALRLGGETIYEVPGLDLPGPELDQSDSVTLFDKRASAANPRFRLEENYEEVAALCRQLDGMPLAIELAAIRVRSISVSDIALKLDETTSVLASGDRHKPARHQTLDAAIDWSFNLLSSDEQQGLMDMSVFRGGFDLDMAEWMLGKDAVDLVTSLVEKSLLVSYEGQLRRRYRMLETVRQFLSRRADEVGTTEVAVDRHAEWCVAFSDSIWGSMRRAGRDRLEMRIHEEFENLQAAYDRAEASGNRVMAGGISEGIFWHWQELGHTSRAIESANRALETCEAVARQADIRAYRGWLYFNVNQDDKAIADFEFSYSAVKNLPASPQKGYILGSYGHMFTIIPELDASSGIGYAFEALDIAKETGEEVPIALASMQVAQAQAWAGLEDDAYLTLQGSIGLIEKTQDPFAVAQGYTNATTIAAQIAEVRRDLLSAFSDRLLEWRRTHPQIANILRNSWISWGLIQRGQFEQAEQILDEDRLIGHLEAFDKLGDLIPRGIVLWMQGQAEEALQLVKECELIGVNHRWYHDFYPLKADVLADLGRVEELRTATAEYVEWETHDFEQAKKLGALNPLVRAEVDASFAGSGEADEHRSAAHDALGTMGEILSDYPPPMSGSVAMETQTTHLKLAEAELSRLDGSDPGLWRTAYEAADFTYYRLYAQWRLAEALILSGDSEEGVEHLRHAHSEATRIGAGLLISRIASYAEEAAIKLN